MRRTNSITTCCTRRIAAVFPLRVRSLVGLMPLLAVETIEPELLDAMPGFKDRLEWYLTNRPDLASLVSRWQEPGAGERRLVALTRGHRMKCLLRRMLDPNEFLSDYGIRSLSKFHKEHPYVLQVRRRSTKSLATNRPNRKQVYSAAIQIGADRSGCRSIICSSNRCRSFIIITATISKSNARPVPVSSCILKQIANELSNRLIQLWLPR